MKLCDKGVTGDVAKQSLHGHGELVCQGVTHTQKLNN